MSKLHEAIAAGNQQLVEELIEREGGVDEVHSETGESPLFHAVRLGNAQIIKLLLENDASFAVEPDGVSAVNAAPLINKILDNAERIVERLPLSDLRYQLFARIYEEYARINLRIGAIDESTRNFQLAIGRLESIKDAETHFTFKLYSFYSQCAFNSREQKNYGHTLRYVEQAISLAEYVDILEGDMIHRTIFYLSLSDVLFCRAECYFNLADQDKAEESFRGALDQLLRVDKLMRGRVFYNAMQRLFYVWGVVNHDSIIEGRLFKFAADVFSDEIDEGGEEALMSDYVVTVGKLTSVHGSAQYKHLLTPMIQVMSVVLDSYADDDFPCIAMQRYLQGDENRTRFSAKLDQLKSLRMGTLQQRSAVGADIVRGLYSELSRQRAENEKLKIQVNELRSQMGQVTTTSASVSLSSSLGSLPEGVTLFSRDSLKRPRDEEVVVRDEDESPEKRAKLEQPKS